MISGGVAVICHRLIWMFDLWTQWQLLGFSLESSRSIVGSISSAMLTFLIFLMSMIFVGLQVAVGQLTPRIIAYVFQSWVIRLCLSIFTFTYMFSISAQGRLENPVPELVVLLTIFFSAVSIGIFLYFVDFLGKSLRPISICRILAEECTAVIESMYPALSTHDCISQKLDATDLGKTGETFNYTGRSGVMLAFDAEGLTKIAARNDCTIKILPQVGDFVSHGSPLFSIYHGSNAVHCKDLCQSVAFGVERTTEQDPEFVFRIIVDIAIKALSPAINDPTTAVVCIDQLHQLLGLLGQRYVGEGTLKDSRGTVRVHFSTPDWDDYLNLAVSEILHYGADSMQVVRRLRAMLEDLLGLPEQRRSGVIANLELLDRTVNRVFVDPFERELAMVADFKGLGGARR
jgi:uncharacterized membrane protein